ncbi:MAG TPA: PAS domain S-box protein [Verrucomicrobiae bacterium]
MKAPGLPKNEVRRLEALRQYDLLDTLPEQALDDLTTLTAQICGTPTCLISLVDENRQWFKSKVGLSISQTPRDISFCAHAIMQSDLFIVPDATKDDRFADNPLVADGLRFYAGTPLLTPNGEALGALCIMDRVPRQITSQQQNALRIIGRQVMTQLELRRQTRELAESETRLHIVTENARVGLFMVDRDHRYLYANKNYAEIVQRPLDEIIGHNLQEVLSDIYLSHVRPCMDRAFSGEHVSFEAVRNFSSGTRYYSAIYEPRITEGAATLVVGVITDITERKRAEAATEQQRNELQIILDAVPAFVFYKDRESRFIRVNNGFARLFEAPPETLVGKTATEMGDPSGEQFRRDDLRVMTSGEPLRNIEEMIHLATGSRWLLTDKIPHRDSRGQITGVIGFAVDITERKSVEEALQRSQADLQLALQAARLGRWNWDIINEQITWSPECLAIYGLPANAQVDYPQFLKTLHPDDRSRIDAALNRAVWERGDYDEEKRVIWPDGSLHWTASRGRVYCNAAGEPVRMTGVTFDITSHKESEAALREALERFETVARATNDAVWDWNLTTNEVWWNDGFQVLFGYLPGETDRHVSTWVKLLHPDEREKIVGGAQAAINNGENIWISEYRFRRKDGSYSHVLDRGYIIRDGAGKPIRMIGAMQDISERKRAEVAANRLAAIVEFSEDAIISKDLDGIITTWNRGAEKVFGYSSHEMVGAPISRLIPEDRGEEEHYMLNQIRDGKSVEHFETLRKTKDGRLLNISVTASPIKDADGKIIGASKVARDITARKQAEERALWLSTFPERNPNSVLEIDLSSGTFNYLNPATLEYFPDIGAHKLHHPLVAGLAGLAPNLLKQKAIRREVIFGDKCFAQSITSLENTSRIRVYSIDISDRRKAELSLRESEERFRQLAENINEVFWITDPAKKQILYVSPAYKKIWGRTCESLYESPRTWLEAICPDDRERVLQAALHRQASGEYDETYRITRPDGSLRWIHDRAFPISDASGHVHRIVGTAEDISNRRLLEEQVRQSQKLEAIGQLAGGVAHDFNNILAAIIMQVDLMDSPEKLPPDVVEGLDEIKASAHRAANLTRQLLLFSRKQVMLSHDLDLNETVTNIAKMLTRIIGEDISLQFNLHQRPLTIHADAGMLDQVLMNLVVNARDAMPSGGRISVELSEKKVTPELAATLPDTAPGLYACLRVSDSGAGISTDNLAHIFEPFFTTKAHGKGTGLGLATVFGIVKQHNGSIFVKSESGIGTTFEILFPLVSTLENVKPGPVTRTQSEGGSETILLVEDDHSLRTLSRIVLQKAGYRVLEASDGIEALSIWETDQGSIQLLLTDLVMPRGINGRELANRIQSSNPKLPVVFTSGYSADVAGRELILEEGQNFIQKPSSPHILLSTIRRSLKR